MTPEAARIARELALRLSSKYGDEIKNEVENIISKPKDKHLIAEISEITANIVAIAMFLIKIAEMCCLSNSNGGNDNNDNIEEIIKKETLPKELSADDIETIIKVLKAMHNDNNHRS